MLKLYDWECQHCGAVSEQFVDVDTDAPQWYVHDCGTCQAGTAHRRLMSAPAQYLADRVMAPRVIGGRHDTMGCQSLPELPPLPAGAVRYETREHRGREVKMEVVSGEAIHQRRSTPEYREAMQERARVAAGNETRKAMAGDVQKGKVRLDESLKARKA
jgi:hypothetical protein